MGSPALDRDALARAVDGLGLALQPEIVSGLASHAELVMRANRDLNLTRITDPEGVAVRHVADSLACLLVLPPGEQLAVADVGSGAGWPGLALAIACPEWKVTLIEARSKKALFLAGAIEALGLSERVRVVAERAETAGHDRAQRETHDAALARAVAPLATLAEYLLPLVRPGGRAVAMKGAELDQERRSAAPAVREMGGTGESVSSYELPGLDEVRQLVVWEKWRKTPDGYPRRPGVARKQPIGGPDAGS